MKWKNVLEYNFDKKITGGSCEALKSAVKGGADLRIYTEFKHNEHIDISSKNHELIKEVSDFPVTFVVDNRWVAGVMTFRQPVTLPDRFGDRPSMSFFMYNQNCDQAVARPYLDANDSKIKSFNASVGCDMSKFHTFSEFNLGKNASALNFNYDFYTYKFLIQDDWTEIYACDENGNALNGSSEIVGEASNNGQELKVGIYGICDGVKGGETLEHEMFVQLGPHYYYTESKLFVAETRPYVRVKPSIPMKYSDNNWDFGWSIVRTDGYVASLYYDPVTLKTKRVYGKHKIRWFTRS